MKTVVVSGVNLRQGGTLTILKDCLKFLSENHQFLDLRVVALVHKKELCYFEGIEYIELPKSIRSWGNRLWCEYVTMRRLSKKLAPIELWLSLHDTSPFVETKRQAVYCQTSFPFYEASLRDLFWNYKIVLFSFFTRFAYKINVKANDYLIVQQPWLREGLSKLLNVDEKKFIVAPPQKTEVKIVPELWDKHFFTFIYPAAPDCHKNFQVLCNAAELLEKEIGVHQFKVVITIDGSENRYTRWLRSRWQHVSSIDFAGFLTKEKLYGLYESADCMVFPSKVETWGLPITEFAQWNKPILVSDLPYACGTCSGLNNISFFDPNDAHQLMNMMKAILCKSENFLQSIPKLPVKTPYAGNWKELFELLLA